MAPTITRSTGESHHILGSLVLGALTIMLLGVQTAHADRRYCSQTAEAMYRGCKKDTEDSYWESRAKCINLTSDEERANCQRATKQELGEGRDECREQKHARRELCKLVGEGRYNPQFVAANFVDPAAIGSTVTPNPYFPLIPGAHWVYQEGDELITVDVTNKIKLIDGVPCRVVTDVATKNGNAIEVTDDWYAQDLSGNVWYCGELSRELETFAGDAPLESEIVDIDGTWKAGRDGAQAGIYLYAAPQVGVTYREEFALGEAEDVATVLSTTASESTAVASCAGNCVVTRNFTPISPDAEETKYYAPGVGLLLELKSDGTRVELREFTIP